MLPRASDWGYRQLQLQPASSRSNVRIGLMGVGVIGGGVARVLLEKQTLFPSSSAVLSR